MVSPVSNPISPGVSPGNSPARSLSSETEAKMQEIMARVIDPNETVHYTTPVNQDPREFVFPPAHLICPQDQ